MRRASGSAAFSRKTPDAESVEFMLDVEHVGELSFAMKLHNLGDIIITAEETAKAFGL